MTNVQVAKCFIGNAIAYGKSGDLETVMVNLLLIEKLLQDPEGENEDYDWDDFK
jgi:hypothetical protein